MTGMFISIEGLEGAGKTTQSEVLCQWLVNRGHNIVRTREPGGTEIAEDIRNLILRHHQETMDPSAELLLIFAARKQHLENLIKPAITSGQWVVTDRFTDATYAYQGGGRQLGPNLIRQLETTVLDDFQPHLTIWFDCQAEIGLARARNRGELDRIEAEDIDFFNRCRAGYLERYERQPERFIKIDASQPIKEVSRSLTNALEQWFD